MKNTTNMDVLVAELSQKLSDGAPLTGRDGAFTPLLKRVIEASLQCEMDAHLAGFGDAIEDLFPATDVQLCLVHQMRGSLKYVNYKDYKAVTKDLRQVYTALNEAAARHYPAQAEQRWGAKYKVIFRSWHANWER